MQVVRWARSQPDPVSVILFGSRARGDHGPDSDWDLALVYDGEFPILDGLPSTLEGREIDWAPIERSRAIRRLNVCGVPHAVAADGCCLHGLPLPTPDRKDVNLPTAWDLLLEAHDKLRDCVHSLEDYWVRPPHRRPGYSTSVAERSALAGELLCKATLSLRGVEPRRSHSVEELCDDLEREFPSDRLIPLLRDCDGLAEQAHVSVYPDLPFPREGISVSAQRLVSVLRASGEVLSAACAASLAGDGKDQMEELVARRAELRSDLTHLFSSDCPRVILQAIEVGLEAWLDDADLSKRLSS